MSGVCRERACEVVEPPEKVRDSVRIQFLLQAIETGWLVAAVGECSAKAVRLSEPWVGSS